MKKNEGFPFSGERTSIPSGGDWIVPCPKRYGLSYDAIFGREREAASPASSVLKLCGENRCYAAFISRQERFLGFQTTSLFPLNGWEESAFIQSNEWTERDFCAAIDLLAGCPSWDMCRLPMIQEFQLPTLRRFLNLHGFSVREHFKPVRVVSGFSSFEEYGKSRGKRFQRSQRQSARNAREQGWEFRHEVGICDWENLYQSRHEKMGDADYTVTPQFLGFMKSLREKLRVEGRLLEFGLWKGPRLGAAALGFASGEVVYLYQTAHDPALKKLRLGAIAIDEALRNAMAVPDRLITFCGNGSYMRLFTNQIIPFYEIEVFPPTLLGRTLKAYRDMRNAAE